MNCPSCGSRTKTLQVHDEQPFRYSECTECSWDDYEEQYHAFRQNFVVEGDPEELNFEGDEDEFEQDC